MKYNTTVIVGAQYGDEGKGKICDFLSQKANAVIRMMGGANAGHTIKVKDHTYKFHLIPSGILNPSANCYIGNGTVVDLPLLVEEIEQLETTLGYKIKNLFISETAHLIFDYHKMLDTFWETRSGALALGTTRRGIGPAYRDKVDRHGIRVLDLRNTEVYKQKFEINRKTVSEIMPDHFYTYEWNDIYNKHLAAFKKIEHRIVDTVNYINNHVTKGELVLFEGAQGHFLDLEHGSYGYVTSSYPTAAGACIGSGVSPRKITNIIGVTKAYTTRVGAGPFVTELHDEIGEKLSADGQEFGTTTGRKRRCGWLDLVMLKRATLINGFTSLAITKLDILDSFDTINVCYAYDIDGKTVYDFPNDIEQLKRAVPLYIPFIGWKTSTKNIKNFDDLPNRAQNYIRKIEDYVQVKASLISVGAERDETIDLKE